MEICYNAGIKGYTVCKVSFKYKTADLSLCLSDALSAALQKKHLVIVLFSKSTLSPLERSFLLSIDAFFPIAILLRISLLQYPTEPHCDTKVNIK